MKERLYNLESHLDILILNIHWRRKFFPGEILAAMPFYDMLYVLLLVQWISMCFKIFF